MIMLRVGKMPSLRVVFESVWTGFAITSNRFICFFFSTIVPSAAMKDSTVEGPVRSDHPAACCLHLRQPRVSLFDDVCLNVSQQLRRYSLIDDFYDVQDRQLCCCEQVIVGGLHAGRPHVSPQTA